jgi:asparagine synthase (glutamine-hydrolysing)
MCGISGFIGQAENCLMSRQDLLQHIARRGPDGEGCVSGDFYVLAHTRLAIIDLSSAAAQPFESTCGKFAIIFNGEILNYKKLKKTLLQEHGVAFRSSGDTEVLLALIVKLGLEKALNLIEGFFSFAFIDKDMRRAFIVRDHLGVKPLYYSTLESGLYFSSSLYTFSAIAKKADYDQQSIANYLVDGFFRAPSTPISTVKKLNPGSYLVVDMNGKVLEQRCYYDVLSEADLKKTHVGAAVKKAASLRKEADVDVALLLSAGVDSSLLAHVYGEMPDQNLTAYTVDFDGHDEKTARKTASKAGLSHEVINFNEKFADMACFNFSEVYDEPLADVSALPTFLVFKELSKKGKVAIGGDGGDELFIGYKRYALLRKYLRCAALLNFIPSFLINAALSTAAKIFPSRSYHFKRLRHLICSNDTTKLSALSCIFLPSEVCGYQTRYQGVSLKDCVVSDIRYYLPDDIFFKVDRASMYCGVEAREPLASKTLVNGIKDRIDKYYRQGVLKIELKEMLFSYDAGYNVGAKRGFSYDINLWAKENYSFSAINDCKKFLCQRGMSYLISPKVWCDLKNKQCSDSFIKLYSLMALVGWMRHWEKLCEK